MFLNEAGELVELWISIVHCGYLFFQCVASSQTILPPLWIVFLSFKHRHASSHPVSSALTYFCVA